MSIPSLPLTKYKYKTRTSFHTFLFAPLKLNFIAISQRTNACYGRHCFEAKCATRVSPPLKEIDVPSMPTFLFIKTSTLVSSKFVGVHHVFCRYPSIYFLMVASPFHQILLCIYLFIYVFSWASYTWGCLLTLCSKGPPIRSGGGIITCLRSSHKVSSLNGLSNETWHVRRTLISGGNSNLSFHNGKWSSNFGHELWSEAFGLGGVVHI